MFCRMVGTSDKYRAMTNPQTLIGSGFLWINQLYLILTHFRFGGPLLGLNQRPSDYEFLMEQLKINRLRYLSLA